MTTWYQACRLDGKIRTFDVIKETPKTLTYWYDWGKREVTIHKVSEGLFCSKSWSVAHGWLMQATKQEVLDAREALDAAFMHKASLDTIEARRYRLNRAKSTHGNVKGLRSPYDH